MKLRRILLPNAALAAALALVVPTVSEGYAVFGDTLNLNQRHFRIWNNFTDPEANDNPIPDPDFPGATGAVLAIWKGVAEWGSAPHGSGTSDPTQDVIGSGESNFDAFFSGLSVGNGKRNDNIISQRDGSSFIKASCDIPIRDGWRIRFWEDPWIWNDGPGEVLTGGADAYDLQGVAAHEYGHALGLDHSLDPDATMYSTSFNKGVSFRSIEADDVAGLQYLYGVRSPLKPKIDGYELLGGGVLRIDGSGFHPTDNEVWFTHRAPTPTDKGAPLKVKGVASSHGRKRLLLTVPPKAGPGEIAVKLPGMRAKDLSNVFPFDPLNGELDYPIAYGTGKTTSQGMTPELTWLSPPSETAGSFTLLVLGAVDGTGILLRSDYRAHLPFQGGTLFVAPPIVRDGVCSIMFGIGGFDYPVPPAMVGESRFFQVWFSDPGDPFGSGLTNGLMVTFLP